MSRVEDTNKALTELQRMATETITSTINSDIIMANIMTYHAGIDIEIAKSLAQLADDIHFLRETTAKEKEEVQKRSNQTCGDCRYSDVIDYIDRGLLTRFDVEFCHRREAEVDFRFTPICDHFKQKEAES